MAVLTQGPNTGAYIVSEANGSLSRDVGTILAGQNLQAGQIVGVVTASSKFAKYDPAATDGTENVAGISYDNKDATDGDIVGAVFSVRLGEVRESDLIYHDGATAGEIITANTELEALFLKTR